jgi:hypothetical protein
MKKLLFFVVLLAFWHASCRRQVMTTTATGGPAMADAFVDSIGINTHVGYTYSI